MKWHKVARWKTYYPLILILFYLTIVSLLANIKSTGFSGYGWMNDFMAGFFLVFSAFKLLDLKGFADSYAAYDLLAARFRFYGYLYPFLELALGLAYLSEFAPVLVMISTIILMGFSSIGVIYALLKKRKIQCACLGSILKLPVSNITLLEDLMMVLMAAVMLLHVLSKM